MGLVWFLGWFYLLATASSFVEKENEAVALGPRVNQSGGVVQMTIHHVHGPGSSLAPQPPVSFSDVLAWDDARVKTLNSRLTRKDTRFPKSVLTKKDIRFPKSVSVPLNPGASIGSGNYYVKVGLGSPARYYSMIVDTGSSLSWLQCKPCVVYCHVQADPLFDPSASKTYKSLSCTSSQCSSLVDATLNNPLCETSSNVCVYTASYGDSSYSMGYLSQDLLTVAPSQTLPGFVYGCGQDSEGLFGRAAGILGLSRNKLSMLGQVSSKFGYAFSYCLPTRGGGGFLSIGKASLAGSAYKFTPMTTDPGNPSLYFLRLTAITVGGRALGVAAAQYRVPTIIDSGTVITRLPMSVYTPFQQAFVKIMSSKYARAPGFSILDTCFKGNLKDMQSVPEVRLIFQGGADLNLRPLNVLLQVDEGLTCLAFAGNNGVAIIGNHQQQTFKVAHDISTARIGFATGGCN